LDEDDAMVDQNNAHANDIPGPAPGFKEFENAAEQVQTGAKESTGGTGKRKAVAPLKEAAGAVLRDTRELLEGKTGDLMAKAQEGYGKLREQATVRSADADVFVREKPYAALAIAAFAGFLIGHIISSGGSKVVYLRDDR
jgi:ElaB/YqjD/DUF883 family membrane-anchored ribosome-binding protein